MEKNWIEGTENIFDDFDRIVGDIKKYVNDEPAINEYKEMELADAREQLAEKNKS